jgi:frataxin-like iron-binding protein CyaY
MKILVTGAAGFIGFHTAQKLLARGDEVVGLDNLNDYYDVRLKHARLEILQREPGFKFAKLDLADREGFEVELQGGVLNLFFEEPTETRFVVSPNAPVRQVWVSALVRSYKLSWSAERSTFELDGEALPSLIERLVHIHLGR